MRLIKASKETSPTFLSSPNSAGGQLPLSRTRCKRDMETVNTKKTEMRLRRSEMRICRARRFVEVLVFPYESMRLNHNRGVLAAV
jgi:hypothetical protein